MPHEALKELPHLDRRDRWPLLGLLALALLTNLIPAQRSFYNSDQAELAYALQDYDVGVEHPHPPGNPLYVACAKLVYWLTGDPLTSLLAVSGALRVGAIVAFYWLVALLYGRWAAVAASSLWVALPSLWTVGVTTFTWAADPCFACLIAASGVQARRGSNAYTLLSAALLAVGLGFRESMVLMVPLWAYCVWRRPRRVVLAALLLAAVLVAAWAAGMVIATGSWERYAEARRALVNEVIKPTTVFFSGKPVQRMLENYGRLTDCILGTGSKMLALAWLLPAIYAAGRAFGLRDLLRDWRPRFVYLWWLPPVAFYVLFHIVHIAHVLIFLPAWVIVAAVGMVLVGADWPRRPAGKSLNSRVLGALCIGVLLFNLAGIQQVARKSILREQAETDDIVEFIAQHFRAEESYLVQADVRRQFLAVMYRLPGYRGQILQQTFGETARPSMAVPSPIKLDPEVQYLVVPEITARIYVPTEERRFNSGTSVRWRKLAPQERYLFFDARGLWTATRPDATDPPVPVPVPSRPAQTPR